VEVDLDQLRALVAAVERGSLDAAARVLHVTPSAVSQRLRALEAATGQVLLVRSRPVRPTPAGEVLLRTARQIGLLLADAGRELAPDGARPVLPIAVNADSLATWVLPALASIADAVLTDVRREDQTRTGALLRDGTVVAAVTTEARPVAGCRSTPLGAMRYRPVATPGLVRRFFGDGVTPAALGTAAVVVFDRADDLQHTYLRRAGVVGTPPTHYVPSSADFLAAVLLGMGWGMLPDLQAAPHLASGALVELDPAGAVDVRLHWQRWALRTPALDTLTAAIVGAARRELRPAGS
jgi:LysR family transcriptional regulator, chromosome initiation inhibitor